MMPARDCEFSIAATVLTIQSEPFETDSEL
jgi:hypothetical protein